MMQKSVEALERLAEADRELAELEEALGKERGAVAGKRDQLRLLDAQLEADRASLKDMDRTRVELVQEVRQMVAQIERSREKLARCRNEREALAAQRELEELRKLQRDREIEISRLEVLSQQARMDVEGAGTKRASILEELDAGHGQVTLRLGTAETRVSEVRQRREEAVRSLDAALYRRYELVRKRRGSAVAHTTDGICSGCHIALPPMMFQTLRRAAKLEQCPNCNRILYFRAVVLLPGGGSGSDE